MGFVAGSSSASISGSTDVALSNPAPGNVLSYDGTASKWKNSTALSAIQTKVNALPNITVSGTAPSSPSVNDIWIDIS